MTTDALIIKGDCLNVMAGLPAASIDAIVTDPPYGLSFMGKDWDKGVPGESFWREALRVAKPGCHILAAGGSRTYHRLTCAIEDAGWEIRDCIIWMYGSGFPKSHNLKDDWQGWGTALKPAFEPFILARKPLDGTVANNVQRHGCGGLNVDGCRVGTEKVGARSSNWDGITRRNIFLGLNEFEGNPTRGRWPANVIHDGSDEVMAVFPDVQSGGGDKRPKKPSTFNACVNKRSIELPEGIGGDSGSASRFFYCAKASPSEREEGLNGLPDVKAGSYKLRTDAHSERNGLTTAPRTNHHPTVKPVDLMKYLCRLITPPGGLILDPFCGSGSTGVAAMREGFNFIGIELNADYAEIARRRIDHERNKTPLFSNVI